MDERRLALSVLSTGIRYGRDSIGGLFGDEVLELVGETFGELHKNNLPEEELIFIVKKAVDRVGCTIPSIDDIDLDSDIDQIHSTVSQLEDYRNEKRMSEIDDFRQKSVLKDFVYYLSKLFFYRDELYRRAKEKFETTTPSRCF